MAALDRSAYPRFPPKLSARDLAACSTPSAEEMARSRLVGKATACSTPQTVRISDLPFLSPHATSHVKRFGEYTLNLRTPPNPWLSEPVFRDALREVRQQSSAWAS